MSQAFEDLGCVFESIGSCSQSASRTITPTQGDYAKAKLRPSDGTKEEIETQRHHLSASTGQLLDLPRVDVEAGWEREQQKNRELEANQDKFSTLFEPSTPRASPTLMPESLPKVVHSANLVSLFDQSHFAPAGYRDRASRPVSISNFTSSDFRTFVEVAASEDPLSSVLGNGHNNGTTAPLLIVEPNLSTEGGIGTPTRAFSHAQHSNTTLDFFGMFTHNAKQRAIAARSQVLDELLLHEDDPMWFTLEGRNEVEENVNDSSIPASPAPPTEAPILNDSTKEKPLLSLMQDIDHEYFRPLPSLSPTRSRSSSPILHRGISRSNSISPLPPAIAPPIACQLTAPLAIGPSHGGESQEFVDTPGIEPPFTDSSIETSSSDSMERPSLSSLSSKLMLSLLRSGQEPSPSSTHTSRSVGPHLGSHETAFPPHSSTTFPSSKPMSSVPRIPAHTETLPIASFATTEKRHIQPVFKRINLSSVDSVTHTTSPFAATFYTPPSGAPGFEGDRYDWDKGFSDELGNGSSSVKDAYGRRDGEGVSASTSSSRSNSRLSTSRGWGTGFGFGFGSVRGQPSGRRSRSPLPVPDSRKFGPASADLQDNKDHDSGPSSKPLVELGSFGGMGEVIERKIGNVELAGRKASSTPVLAPELASMLRAHLPALSRLPRSWMLIYSLDQHGISLNTLYSHCESHLTRKPEPGEFGVSKGMLLAIKDAGAGDDDEHRALFGAWIAEGFKMNKGKGYSGGGESFLWKYIDGALKIFKATGRNNYVALCEPEYLSFGGGDGHYGLYLDESLFDGSSAPCPTFDNEPLCSGTAVGNMKTVKFECVGLEVWGMG